MSQNFTHLIRVRYGECDAQGVVFNPRYADYVDIASTEFIRHACGGYQQLVDAGLDVQVVSLKLDWSASASFDDVLAISVTSKHIGNTSFSLSFEIKPYKEQAALVVAEVVYVMIDAKLATKIAIPQNLKEKIKLGAPGVVVDHAGVAT